jgi:hypothetical protein
MQGIVDVESVEQRITAQATSQGDDLGARIRALRRGLGVALLLSAGVALIALMPGWPAVHGTKVLRANPDEETAFCMAGRRGSSRPDG